MTPRAGAGSAIATIDPAFADVVRRSGPLPALRSAPVRDRFPALTRSITHQLLATSAATTIHRRVVDACGGEVSVERVLHTPLDALRAAGLSHAKAEAIRDLAADVRAGRIRLERHGRLDDDAVTDEITTVRGIGPWTAHMYLLFTLARPDVWPTGDYGVRVGWSRLHDLPETISARDLRAAGEPFAGLRSAVALYCWRAIDVPATTGPVASSPWPS